MTIAINRDEVREAFRDKVLAALDDAAEQWVGPRNGWHDKDLPQLFKALDVQIERWADCHDIALLDPVM